MKLGHRFYVTDDKRAQDAYKLMSERCGESSPRRWLRKVLAEEGTLLALHTILARIKTSTSSLGAAETYGKPALEGTKPVTMSSKPTCAFVFYPNCTQSKQNGSALRL